MQIFQTSIQANSRPRFGHPLSAPAHTGQPVTQPTSTPPKSIPKFGFYSFNTSPGERVSIPQHHFSLLEETLNKLIKKIRAGEYTVEPGSNRKSRRNFRRGIRMITGNLPGYQHRLFMTKSNVVLRPKSPESDLKSLRLKTSHRSLMPLKVQLEFETKQGGLVTYLHSTREVKGILFDFISAVADEVQKIRKGESGFDPDAFRNLNL